VSKQKTPFLASFKFFFDPNKHWRCVLKKRLHLSPELNGPARTINGKQKQQSAQGTTVRWYRACNILSARDAGIFRPGDESQPRCIHKIRRKRGIRPLPADTHGRFVSGGKLLLPRV